MFSGIPLSGVTSAKVPRSGDYISLEKRIEKEKEKIEQNELSHRTTIRNLNGMIGGLTDEDDDEDYDEDYYDYYGCGDRERIIRRLPHFDPSGLPDLTPGVTEIPYKIPDYNDPEVMKEINEYRDEYWKDMDTFMEKYKVKTRKDKGDLPSNVTLSDRQFDHIELPSDLTLEKKSSFQLLNNLNFSCDNIKCLDMNCIYVCDSRTMYIPMYTHDKEYELCGLCLIGLS